MRVFVCAGIDVCCFLTYVRVRFRLGWVGTWMWEIESDEKKLCFLLCVCVRVCGPQCACLKPSMSDWQRGAWVSCKTAGCLHQLCCDNKINIHCVNLSPAWCSDWNVYDLPRLTDGHIWGRSRRYMYMHQFGPIVLIMLASVASNGGRLYSPSFWVFE